MSSPFRRKKRVPPSLEANPNLTKTNATIFTYIETRDVSDSKIQAHLTIFPWELNHFDVRQRSVFSAIALATRKELLHTIVKLHPDCPSLLRHDEEGLSFLAHVANLDDPGLFHDIISALASTTLNTIKRKRTYKEVSLISFLLASKLSSKYELIRTALDSKFGLGYELPLQDRLFFFHALISTLAFDEERNQGQVAPPTDEQLRDICYFAKTTALANLVFVDQEGRNATYWACENGQSCILPYLEVTAGKIMLPERHHGFSAVLICCADNFSRLTTKSRRACMEYLVSIPGVAFDIPSSTLNVTPLFYCVAYGSFCPSQQDVAEFLVEQGANIFWENKDNFSCLYFAIYSNATTLVRYALESGKFDLTKKIKNTKREPLAFLCNCFLYTFLTDEQEANGEEADFELVRLFRKMGAPTVQAMFYLCLNISAKAAPNLFLELIYLGAEVSKPAINHMSLLMNLAVSKDYSCFKVLVREKADLDYKFVPRLCLNTPNEIHRWMSYEKIEQYFADNKVPVESTYVCHICFQKITLFQGVNVCSNGESCDCRVCSECAVFSPGRAEVTLTDIVQKMKVPNFFKTTLALTQSDTGNALFEAELTQYLDMFIEAKLDKFVLLGNLDKAMLQRLGVGNQIEQHKLRSAFASCKYR